MRKLRVAIIGQGRSGSEIHGAYFLSEGNNNVEVVYVVDELEIRRERASKVYSCPMLSDYRELFDKKEEIDLVVNASYSQFHYSITKDLLCHGFNVLVEKPLARTSYECYDLIATAKKHNVIVTGFHQTLITPSFLEIKEIIDSGKLGEVFQISLKYSGFARRWDWQTMQGFLGGSVYNTGPHPIGFALDILGFDPETRVAFSKLDRALVSGDAEDYAKIILTAPGKPVVDIEISSMDAYSDFQMKFQGTMGTLKSTSKGYSVKYIIPGENPDQELYREPMKDDKGLPKYCGEKLVIHEETEVYTGTAFDVAVRAFYEMVYNKLTKDEPMAITPEMAAHVINIIEVVHGQNPMQVWC